MGMTQIRHDVIKIKFLLGMILPLIDSNFVNANDNVASDDRAYAIAA